MSDTGDTRMNDFNINELMLFIVGVLGAQVRILRGLGEFVL